MALPHIEALRPEVQESHHLRVAPPCALVVFGATGDLTHRKLMPAIARLISRGLIREHFAVVGVARRSLAPKEFAAEVVKSLGEFAPGLDRGGALAERLDYVT